jgi:TrmH family RNA methyltransferase
MRTSPAAELETTLTLARVRVVLVEPRHPGNIGAAARAMLTMGLTQLALVRPADFPHRAAYERASAATGVLDAARVCGSLEEAVQDCAWVIGTSSRPRHLGDEPLLPWEAAARLVEGAAAADVALVFGCERTGLTNEEIDRCQATTIVPANPSYASLNVASAVQIYAYELRKASVEAPRVSTKGERPWYAPSSIEELENFYEHLERVLTATGFLDPANPRLLMRRLRQLVGRAIPDRNELNILRGILSSVERPKRRRPSP